MSRCKFCHKLYLCYYDKTYDLPSEKLKGNWNHNKNETKQKCDFILNMETQPLFSSFYAYMLPKTQKDIENI